jgi:ferredoxin-like protein FixX
MCVSEQKVARVCEHKHKAKKDGAYMDAAPGHALITACSSAKYKRTKGQLNTKFEYLKCFVA